MHDRDRLWDVNKLQFDLKAHINNTKRVFIVYERK